MKLNKIGEVWNSANRLLHVSDLIGLLSSKNFATMAMWRNDFSSLLLTPKGDYTKTFVNFFMHNKWLSVPNFPSEAKMYNFQDETTSIPVTFIRETHGFKLRWEVFTITTCRFSLVVNFSFFSFF